MDLNANLDLDANIELEVDVDTVPVNVDAELNANVDVQLDIEEPIIETENRLTTDAPMVNIELEADGNVNNQIDAEINVPETTIEVNVDANAGPQQNEAGGDSNITNDNLAIPNDEKKKNLRKQVSIFAGLGDSKVEKGLDSAMENLLNEGRKRDKVRHFVLVCNTLQITQALINIGLAIFFAMLSELFLQDYMIRWGHDNIMGYIKYGFYSGRFILKLFLLISLLFTFTRCAMSSRCGGATLFISNTLLLCLVNMAYTVFPTSRSVLYILWFYLQFAATLVGIRLYLAYEKLEYDMKKAALSSGVPLFCMTIIISILDTEYSSDLIWPNILLFFWGISASYTNLLCLEGKKKYVDINNVYYGSQAPYVDMFINLYEVVKGVFVKDEEEGTTDLEYKMSFVY